MLFNHKPSNITYFLSGLIAMLILIAGLAIYNETAFAATVDISIDGCSTPAKLTDGSYATSVSFGSEDVITVTSDKSFSGIYIVWNCVPSKWTLSYGEATTECGKNGFLHEYVKLDTPTTSASITLSAAANIADIYCLDDGELPDFVQLWEPSCEKADILVLSTHADDEILFMGGVLSTYGGQQDFDVQLYYMCNYWNWTIVREHEKLDGLWTSGITHYPVNAPFPDHYVTSYEQALSKYSYSDVLSDVTSAIRRFKPQIVVTHDRNGEYGHGAHMLLANTVMEAADNSMKDDFCPESATEYGVWDIPKTYLHLYPENNIKLNLREPLSRFDDKTAIDVANEAYKKHVSQQYTWFYVSDTYAYSCASFGAYRNTLAPDTANSMTENIISYKEQARIAEEASRQAEIEASLEASRQASIEASIQASVIASSEALVEAQKEQKKQTIIMVSVLGVMVFALQLIIIFIFYNWSRNRARKKNR